MKAIPIEQLGERLTKALEQQDEHEAIRLTKGAGTLAWVVRVPQLLKDTNADATLVIEGPDGHVVFSTKPKQMIAQQGCANGTPVFGAGRGNLSILSDDDEHLKDFREYME